MRSAAADAGTPPARERVSLLQIALAIGAITLTSFGGGQKASIRATFVTRHKWIDDAEFLEALELAQILPGPNLVNLCIYIGKMLRGWAGATVALLAVSIPPFAIVLVVGAVYFKIRDNAFVHSALLGCAAAALGLTVANAIDLTREQALRPVPLLFLVATAVAVTRFHAPLLLVLAVLGTLCALLYRPQKQKA